MKALTPKQEKFAQLYVELGNASDAYRQSYNVRPNTKATSINEKASQLLNRVDIQSRVKELQIQLEEKHGVTKEWIINEYKEIIEWYKELRTLGRKDSITDEERSKVTMLRELIKGSDATKSLDSLVKMHGFNEPEKVETKDTTHRTEWG